jgi:hypothetical protein
MHEVNENEQKRFWPLLRAFLVTLRAKTTGHVQCAATVIP